MAPKKARPDICAEVTANIIAALESGVTAEGWRAPWHDTTNAGMPYNVASKKNYRGTNTVQLWAAQMVKGYDSNVWGTFNQWKARGGIVRKGERSTPIIFWKFGEKKNDDPEAKKERYAMARGYAVFNLAQVDGVEVAAPVEREPLALIAEAEAFFAGLGADVRHGGNQAYYTPAADRIQLPPVDAFTTPEGYYSTSAHEHTHWTAAKNRCDRTEALGNRFGTAAYAAEELVAELGAAFLCSVLGIVDTPRPDHAQYVASWITLLRNDPKAIVTASSKAQAAVDWMCEKVGLDVSPAEDETDNDTHNMEVAA